ncbi:hypothetical protein [Rosistilla oblonga]|uniref:hypothetical protein n=1 Tax=Rosistilla oblonga TaxID=2527990 RepID=UPI003A972156
MQPSELWRRGVVMPLSTGVIERIAAWDVDDSVEVDFLPIDDESLFHQLWDIGLFSEINDACSTLIDDYESEWLPQEQFPAAAEVVKRLQHQNSNGRVGQFLNHLSDMIDRATVRQMPLYFEC